MAKDDKKKITQTEQPTVQAPAPAEPTLSGERQQFGQPVQQGFGGGSLGVNTDLNNPTTPTAEPTEQATPTPSKSATQELIDSIKAGSEEERQRIEKRRQAEETISGIADMGKALSNLYFTGKGAPNMYDAKTAMTPKARERYERALKNWEKNRAASMQYALSKQSADLRQQQLDENERHHKEQEDYNRARMEMEAAKQQWKELLADKQLSLKEKIAMMNDATRRWSTSMRLSQATIAHTLQPYIVTEEDMYDKDGRKIGKKKTRLIIDNNGNVKDIKTEEERNTTTTTTAQQGSGKAPNGWNSSSNSTTKKGNKSGRSPQGW